MGLLESASSGNILDVLRVEIESLDRMRMELKRFWRAPLLNKLHSLSTLYYEAKGAVVYRLMFKSFGKGSFIRRPLLISNPQCMSIGDRVFIREGARLEVICSGTELPELRIGNDSSIEQNVHIVCRRRVHIGDRVAISANCAILDVAHPYEDVQSTVKILSRIRDEDSFVEIGTGSLIGLGAVILPNVRIGRNVVIGANSVVTRDIPDFVVAAGNPAQIIRRYDASTGTWIGVKKTVVKESVEADNGDR